MMTTLCNALGLPAAELVKFASDERLEVARCALATMTPGEHTALALNVVETEIKRRLVEVMFPRPPVEETLQGRTDRATLSIHRPDGSIQVLGSVQSVRVLPRQEFPVVEIDPARQLMPVYRGGVDPVTEGIQEGHPRLSRSIHQTPGTTARVVKCHALWSAPSSITGVRARHVCQEPMGHNPPCRCTCKAESLEPAFRRPAAAGELADLDLGPLPWACELCGTPCAAENGVICGACRRKGGVTVADLETAATLAAAKGKP